MGAAAGLQLTTVLCRLGRVLSGAPLARPAEVLAVPAAREPASQVVQATAARARTLLPAGARAQYDELVGGLTAQGDARGTDVLARTLATTWSVTAVAEMSVRWSALAGPSRSAVHDPPGSLGRAGRQSDRTTCGSAVLTMLAAAGDPALALWLATGDLVRSGRPPELVGAPGARLTELARATPEERFAPVQRAVKHRTNARALLGLPWPTTLGTPPWGAAREARFVGLTFGHAALDDTDRDGQSRALDAVGAAVDRGVPVPLYSGGDLRGGPTAAVPRHLVLVVGRQGEQLRVWEPGSGRTSSVSRRALLEPAGALPALGGWTHVSWAVLPVL